MSDATEPMVDMEEEFEFNEDTLETEDEEVEVVTIDDTFDANLANAVSAEALREIGQQSQESYENLRNARDGWEERIKQGIKWLGLTTSKEAGNTGQEDSCMAVHPLLMENVVKFQAKAIQELWPAKGPVRTKIKGFVNAEREATAARVRGYMNYQLTERVPGFYSDMERNLFRVGFMGTGLRKAGWNPSTGAPDPAIVHVENFFVDPAVTHLKHAEDYIELMEMSSRKLDNLVQAQMFREPEDGDCEEILVPNDITETLNEAQGFDSGMERKGYLIGERHCYLDLCGDDTRVPGEGGTAPYIVHFNIKTGTVYSIRRNWREADVSRDKRIWYSADQFIPAFGFYGLGFVHLIGDLAASSTATLRALVDSGQMANWQAGFKSQDAKLSNSDTPLAFGEWRDVNLSPEDLQKAFLPLPAKEPSQVLFHLLQFMVASGQKFADATDQVVQDATNYGPAATTLALLEASQRFYSSIHKRLHQSQHEFFRIIGELNYENLPDTINFVVGDENQFVRRQDFNPDIVDIVPASDPNALSESQRVAKAQIELEMAARFPQLHDMREALRRFYSALGTDAPEKLLVNPQAQAISADPLTELQAAMSGKPIKAQMGQDHAAHIMVKEAFMKSPQMQGTNDPTIAVGLQLLMSNIAEHKTLVFVAQVMQMAQQSGVSPQDPRVQAAISQKLMEMSAASGIGQPQESVEQQMIKLQKVEQELSAARIRSQDMREAAKQANKDRELDLKAAEFATENARENLKLRISSAEKVLDNSAKMADIAVKRLVATSGNNTEA
jgi:hypothetical protein